MTLNRGARILPALLAVVFSISSCSVQSDDVQSGGPPCDAACVASYQAELQADETTSVTDPGLADDPSPTEDPLPDYPDEPEVDQPETVTFKVTGNGERAASITYYVDGSIRQKTNVRLPWKKTITVDEPSFSGFNMNAQNDDGTKIKCSIAVDGEIMQRATSTGAYSVVSCATEDPNYLP